jgi:hypothetical protein
MQPFDRIFNLVTQKYTKFDDKSEKSIDSHTLANSLSAYILKYISSRSSSCLIYRSSMYGFAFVKLLHGEYTLGCDSNKYIFCLNLII